jgi:hypothetical protein
MSATFIIGNNLPLIGNRVANTVSAASEKPKLFIEHLLPDLKLIVKYCMSSVKKVLFIVKSVTLGTEEREGKRGRGGSLILIPCSFLTTRTLGFHNFKLNEPLLDSVRGFFTLKLMFS